MESILLVESIDETPWIPEAKQKKMTQQFVSSSFALDPYSKRLIYWKVVSKAPIQSRGRNVSWSIFPAT